MNDDSPWQDLKDAKTGAKQALTKMDQFAQHSTTRVIGPLATKALGVSKRAYNRWFLHDDHQRPLPSKKQMKPGPGQTWSFSGLFLKMFGWHAEEPSVAPDVDPQPSDETHDV